MIKDLKNPGSRVIIRLLQDTKGKEGIMIVQEALNRMGKNLLVDGIFGPVTTYAIKSVNNRLMHEEIEKLLYPELFETESDPFADNTTDETEDSDDIPLWVKIAYQELGTKEIIGVGSNSRIMQYHSVAGGAGWTDDVPWCGSFLAFVITKAGLTPPKYPARALSWLKFGVSSYIPVYGSIAVKKRRGGGHATLVVGRSKGGKYLYCLGGNQNDAVNIKKYPTSVFFDFRVPYGYMATKELPVMKGGDVVISEA